MKTSLSPGIVAQEGQALQRLLPAEGLQLADRSPPVIVVAPQENFPARQGVNEGQVRQGLLQGFGPGDISADKDRILRPHSLLPGLDQPFGVIGPAGAENRHGFVDRARQVKICDGKEFHARSPGGACPCPWKWS